MSQELLEIIRRRHSAREPFDASRSIATPELAMILEAARWAPTPANTQNFELLLVDDGKVLEAIAKIPAETQGPNHEAPRTFLGRPAQGMSLLLFILHEGTTHAGMEQPDLRGHAGLGCVMENMWLMAESLGVGFHVLTVFSGSDIENELRATAQIPSHKKVAFVCGLGYPRKAPEELPRVRRELDEFVHHNQFGRKDIAWSSPQ